MPPSPELLPPLHLSQEESQLQSSLNELNNNIIIKKAIKTDEYIIITYSFFIIDHISVIIIVIISEINYDIKKIYPFIYNIIKFNK